MSVRRSDHDVSLPDWGPYSKKYAGISHIADAERGLRFDLSVFPGYYRGRVDPPRVTWESGYYPWEASADLEYFSNRHELEWKDRLYTDIAFSRIDERRRLIRCDCVNRGKNAQSIALHFAAFMNFPPLRTYSDEILHPSRALLPEGAVWIDALDYESMAFAAPRPTDGLQPDGQLRAEERGDGFVGGSFLGQGFGRDEGDRVRYALPSGSLGPDSSILLRFRMPTNVRLGVRLSGCIEEELRLSGTGDIASLMLPVAFPKNAFIEFVSEGGAALELDGFALGSAESLAAAKFETQAWDPVPVIIPGPRKTNLILKYRDCPTYYGLGWHFEDFDLRQFFCSSLDEIMRHYVHDHVDTVFRGEGFGHFADLVLRPIEIPAGSVRTLYATVCSASSLDEAQALLADSTLDRARLEEISEAAARRAFAVHASQEGETYRFSQEKLAVVALTNVVYPIYTKRSFIRHRTPGRWWDCLYTWDSGFTGLGLLEIDEAQAAENLDAYLTEPDDDQAAFMHHGSPVPVQFYLFLELWNRTQKHEYLTRFYPKLRHYYRFFAGKEGGSTTASLGTGMLKTWDYFYNSGGWDDYPPQLEVHATRAEATVAPVITSAQCVRIAKIMRIAALALGLGSDAAEYEADIRSLTRAIQGCAWDQESGYFGYVLHDDEGTGILRHESGVNYDMGLDGAYPLVAGICTSAQEKALVENLSSPERLWTQVGITTVDKRAPYYRIDGYWNGAVWMAHQWFFWKTMLDLGRGDFAFKIAKTALDAWKRETDDSYRCVEHFVVDSGRGAGWHQFGGLSCPVLSWFAAYYSPGRLNLGLDSWVESYGFSPDGRALEARLRIAGRMRKRCAIATMAPGPRYTAIWNGCNADYSEPTAGALCVELLGGNDEVGSLIIQAQ